MKTEYNTYHYAFERQSDAYYSAFQKYGSKDTFKAYMRNVPSKKSVKFNAMINKAGDFAVKIISKFEATLTPFRSK